MGIRNFSTILKRTTAGVRPATYSQFWGETWAIDGSIFGYRFSHNAKEKRPNCHIDGFYQLFIRLLRNHIRPVLIFDGEAPQEKHHELERRAKDKQKKYEKLDTLQQELTAMTGLTETDDLVKVARQFKGSVKEAEITAKIEEIKRTDKSIIRFNPTMYEDIRILCQFLNIPVIRSAGESDALCAKLYQTGQVHAILSEDSDILMYGGARLIRKSGWTNDVELVELDKILDSFKITYNQFVDLALLCGTDYTDTKIPGVSPNLALDYIIKGMAIEDILKLHHFPPERFGYQEARNLIMTAQLKEPDFKIEPFYFSQVNLPQLTTFMLDKCHYQPKTLIKHLEIVDSVHRPKLKLKLMLK
jgi:5'-3' exonuclease